MTFFAHKGSVTRKERRTPKKQNRCNKNKRVFKLSYLLPHCPLRQRPLLPFRRENAPGWNVGLEPTTLGTTIRCSTN